MISADTKVITLDIDTGEPFSGTISDLFNLYIDKVEKSEFDWNGFKTEFMSVLDCKKLGLNLKIQDWTGWSEVEKILKMTQAHEWFKIVSEIGDKELNITFGTFVPVYDKDDIQHGFHGEVKYAYKQSTIEFASEYMKYMRIRNIEDESDNIIQFSDIKSIERYMTEPRDGYEILTKSRFYNANDYHLLAMTGGDFKNEKMYK